MRKHLGSRSRQQARELAQLRGFAPRAPVAEPPAAKRYEGIPRLGLGYGLSAHLRNTFGTRKHRTDNRRLTVADQLRITRAIEHAAALVEDAKRSRPQPDNRLARRRR